MKGPEEPDGPGSVIATRGSLFKGVEIDFCGWAKETSEVIVGVLTMFITLSASRLTGLGWNILDKISAILIHAWLFQRGIRDKIVIGLQCGSYVSDQQLPTYVVT